MEHSSTRLCRLQNISAIRLFAVVVLAGSVLFWIAQVLFRGFGIEFSFCNYTEHLFGNDFYFPMAAGQYEDPWGQTGLNYPAGAILLGRIVLHILPSDSIYPYGSPEYQTLTYAAAPLMLMIVLGTVLILACVVKAVKTSENEKLMLCMAIAISSPMMFEWISGNYIIISGALSFAFLLMYDSERPIVRIASYVLLGIASTLKLYPAAFAWMIIVSKRNLKEFIYCAIIVALLTIAPFFVYNGFESILAFLGNLSSESSVKFDWGMGYNFGLQNIVKTISFLLGSYIPGQIPLIIKVLIVLFLILATLTVQEKWQQCYLIALCFILYFDYSYTYTLIFFVPALCFFLGRSTSMRRLDLISFVGFLLIFTPLPLPGIEAAQDFISNYSPEAVFIYPLSWSHVLTMLGLFLVLATILYSGVEYLIQRYKKN